jgi:hypothetical protein
MNADLVLESKSRNAPAPVTNLMYPGIRKQIWNRGSDAAFDPDAYSGIRSGFVFIVSLIKIIARN